MQHKKGRKLKEALHNLSLFYAKFVSRKLYGLNDAFDGNLNLIVSKVRERWKSVKIEGFISIRTVFHLTYWCLWVIQKLRPTLGVFLMVWYGRVGYPRTGPLNISLCYSIKLDVIFDQPRDWMYEISSLKNKMSIK